MSFFLLTHSSLTPNKSEDYVKTINERRKVDELEH
jgi:hypothetical protein